MTKRANLYVIVIIFAFSLMPATLEYKARRCQECIERR